MYNLEGIRKFKKFFRVEGTLLGFKFNLNQKLKSKCYYDFGLKYKLKGNLKKFFSWKQHFKNNLYLKSLYLKKEISNANFFFFQKKSKNFLSLNFSNIFVNNYEKLKKFHIFKIFNRKVLMFNENHNDFPLNIKTFLLSNNWYLNFMYKIKLVFFNKFKNLLKNISLFRKFIIIFLKKNKIININYFLNLKQKISKKFLKQKFFYKRPFFKYVFRKICKYKRKYQRKNKKHQMKRKFKYQFRFIKKFKWNKKKIFKWNKKENLKILWKKNKSLKWNLRNKIFGISLQKRFNKVYLNNIIRCFLYNSKLNLKRYYNLTLINYNIKYKMKKNMVVFLKKQPYFFSSYIVWFNKSYLKMLNKFYIIILLLYKKNNLVNEIKVIINLLIKFKYYLLKIIKN